MAKKSAAKQKMSVVAVNKGSEDPKCQKTAATTRKTTTKMDDATLPEDDKKCAAKQQKTLLWHESNKKSDDNKKSMEMPEKTPKMPPYTMVTQNQHQNERRK